ncbi:nectin-4 isoform 1-T1 [Synchiropus picturatus]
MLNGRWDVVHLVVFAVSVTAKFIEPSGPRSSLLSIADAPTRLPCLYQAESHEKVVQVTWSKLLKNGTKDQIITVHFQEGHTAFGQYSNRVKMESKDPMDNSALLIPITQQSDEGVYTCHIATYPLGNFERKITLSVWKLPLSSVYPEVMVEGQSFRRAAACRAAGHPRPRLTWDTDLTGRVDEREGDEGSASTYFLLHPLRSMNGKRLDCLVWHPGLEQPMRLKNTLEVHYPPDASITSNFDDLYVGLQDLELTCVGGGNPAADNITWTWSGGDLPEGVTASGGSLKFGRGLYLNDSSVYQCVAVNAVGVSKTEFLLTVAAKSRGILISAENLYLIVFGSLAGAAVMVLIMILLLVNRHHRRKNKRLEQELDEKTNEINSFSRQASLRRLNSVSSDPRSEVEDYGMLRVDSRIKNSQMSMQERPIYKGSQSTLGGRWGHADVVDVDELGRPVVWGNGRESLRVADLDAERRRRVESYVQSSNMSLDSGLPSSLVPLKVQPDDGFDSRNPNQQLVRGGGSPSEGDWVLPAPPPPEGPDDSNSVYQLSEALTNHFYYSNGLLRPLPHSKAILLQPQSQVI